MFKSLTFTLLATCSIANATPVETWSGAGPNSCDGRCSMEWAIGMLTTQEQDELSVAMSETPMMQDIQVNDGDLMTFTTYYKDHEPRAYRSATVAALNEPTGSSGWQMEGWAFVQLDACQNWTIITDDNIGATNMGNFPNSEPRNNNEVRSASRSTSSSNASVKLGIDVGGHDHGHSVNPVINPVDPMTPVVPVDPNVPSVPLPASIMYLLAAIGILVVRKVA